MKRNKNRILNKLKKKIFVYGAYVVSAIAGISVARNVISAEAKEVDVDLTSGVINDLESSYTDAIDKENINITSGVNKAVEDITNNKEYSLELDNEKAEATVTITDTNESLSAGINRELELKYRNELEEFKKSQINVTAGVNKALENSLREALINNTNSQIKTNDVDKVMQAQDTENTESYDEYINEDDYLGPLVEYESDYVSEVYDYSDEYEYLNQNCSPELKQHIIELSYKYDIPSHILFTIFDQESRGNWNNNGKKSSTADWGVAQINEKNLGFIAKNTGFTIDEIKNDEFKGAEAGAFYVRYIFDWYGYTKDNYNQDNVFGTYNGWLNWRQKPAAVKYVKGCNEILQNNFTKVENTNLSRTLN